MFALKVQRVVIPQLDGFSIVLLLLTYSYPVDTLETPPEPQHTVTEGNQNQLEDKPPPGAI